MIAIVAIQFIYKNINITFINSSSNYIFEMNSIMKDKSLLLNFKNIMYHLNEYNVILDSYFINFNNIITVIEFISICIIIASIGKSAQFGLHI
jgi:NADH:ubiquinone oxidoreductase subunit 5 (subunit L)/multisubunit Na+/H+ antiporter MnhA subunit